MSQKIAIIGGGVIGLCSAYYLLHQGYDITVIERGDLKDGTSFGNAGYVSPSHFTPLASPGIIAKGLRWMLSASSPFYIKPRADAALIKWGFLFWKNANASTVKRNTPHLLNLLNLSRELTCDIKNELGNQFRMEEKGCLMLFKSASTEHHEIELAHQAEQFGIETQIYSASEVQDLEPDVQLDVRGGVLYPIDCHLHPGDFMNTLKAHLQARGVRFNFDTEVTGFEKRGRRVTRVNTKTESIDTDEVLVTAGSWLPQLSRLLGVSIVLQAGKGYSITYQNVARNLHYPAILVDNRVAMTPMGGDLRMGGTMEISGINKTILPKRVQAIFDAAKLYYPDLPVEQPTIDKVWSGLRPLSPDGLPYIGRARDWENLTIAGGHAMLGISLAAGTGKIIEEIINRKKTSIDISAFDVHRFD